MIVPGKSGSDFNALQGRLSAENKAPLLYVLFDVPYLEGRSLRDVPLIERKALLATLLKKRKHRLLSYSEHHVGFDDPTGLGTRIPHGVHLTAGGLVMLPPGPSTTSLSSDRKPISPAST